MRLRIAVMLAALLLGVGLLVDLTPHHDEGETVVAPVATPTPTPTPTPMPSPPPAEPFDLTVDRVWGNWLGNEVIFGEDTPEPDSATLEGIAAEAAETVAAFLDAMFVDETTRFSPAAADVLLDDVAMVALREEDHAALGVIGFDDLAGTQTGPASARATVLLDHDGPHMVWLAYRASTTAILDDGDIVPLTQSGNLIMLPTDDGWRARTVDVTTTAEEA